MKHSLALLFLLAVILLTASCSQGGKITSAVESTTDTPIVTADSSDAIDGSEATPDSTAETEAKAEEDMISEVHTISAAEAKSMMDKGGVTVVDVRRADEYASGHIPSAILVPNETIATEAENALPDKEAVLLIYCRSGRRSAEAAAALVSLGYRNVYDFGGILDWEYDVTTE